MRITWKDGVTTLAAVGALFVERAYALSWGWPLVNDARWAIVVILALIGVGFVFSYALDATRNVTWNVIAAVLGLVAVVTAGLGLYYATSAYVTWLMLEAVAFWAASIVRHLMVPTTMTPGTPSVT